MGSAREKESPVRPEGKRTRKPESIEIYKRNKYEIRIQFIHVETPISSAAFGDTKPHYMILDGLRGVAAIMVVWFHIFEAYATSHLDQKINHGYLAVDFFFILSGFVIGYAYDDRLGKR